MLMLTVSPGRRRSGVVPWGPPPVGRTVRRRQVRELLATMGWRRRPEGCQPVFWRVFLALLSGGVQGKEVGRGWEEGGRGWRR
jgi:hypothetical protein